MRTFEPGLFIAFEPVHHLSDWARAVSRAFGDTSPYLLINAGLAGIGLRGALGGRADG